LVSFNPLKTSGAIVFELPTDSTDINLIISGDWVLVFQVKIALDNLLDRGKDTTQKDEIMDEAMADAHKQMIDLMQQYS